MNDPSPPAHRPFVRPVVFEHSLPVGALVVHEEHGIARFEGIDTIEAAGSPHDCFRLVYANDDKLFVPVEHADSIAFYGAPTADGPLDRLGSERWSKRRDAAAEHLRRVAADLVRTEALREAAEVPPIRIPKKDRGRFAAGFAHPPTRDQQAAFAAVEADLASGRLMDRIVCGDVGFGKTEVALRAAFLVARSGGQVALVAPTTPLARQHAELFAERFAPFRIEVAELSRAVPASDAAEVRRRLRSGDLRIVVGTHALLARSVRFAGLGLLIVDEEQRFGVRQKERLRQLARSVHVLTMTATPIPRTLQLSLVGLRDTSVITTPPPGRLPVRTEVLRFDRDVVAAALAHERARGGQIFYVCPRLAHLDLLKARVAEMLPQAGVALAHGRMRPAELDAAMSGFVHGRFDVLVSTNIIESGLDIPNANTLVVHRSDLFGMAQLYQLRGRVGRSPRQAHALLTYEAEEEITPAARRRLEALTELQALGSGFRVASRDLDIRGAGALFGEEQSGHLGDLGPEMLERMLAEAVRALREGGAPEPPWHPDIRADLPVLIPPAYVPHPEERVRLYRRLADAQSAAAVEEVTAGLAELYGPLPPELRNLLALHEIRRWCRRRQVAEVDIGPKGVLLAFRDGRWPSPQAFSRIAPIEGVTIESGEKIVYRARLPTAEARIAAARKLIEAVERSLGGT